MSNRKRNKLSDDSIEQWLTAPQLDVGGSTFQKPVWRGHYAKSPQTGTTVNYREIAQRCCFCLCRLMPHR